MFRAAAALVFPIAGLAATLGACAPEKQLYIGGAWVRLAAVEGRPAAAYFTIHGGPTDATLVSVSTEVAVKTELHESMATTGGAMKMDAIRQVAIPALGQVRFAPGGKHAMLFDVNPAVKSGGTITFVFTFADATRIEKDAQVIAAGDPAPAA